MLETDAKSSTEQAFLVEDTLYTLLSSVQAYTIAQDAIATHLSNGVFSMTLARKQKGVFIAKPEDIREEFTASSTLTPKSDCTFEGSISTNPSDLLQICALPPPPLRKAQQEFRQCLERIVQAQQAIIGMRRTLQTIDPTGQPFVIPSIPTKKTSEETTTQSISSNVSSSAVSKDAEARKSPLKSDHVDQQATKLDAESDADDDSDDDDPGFDSDDANNMPLPEILSDDCDEDDDDEGDDE
jgi:hypothetical protein